MLLWASLLVAALSAIGVIAHGSASLLGELAAVSLVISTFVLVCATEARH